MARISSQFVNRSAPRKARSRFSDEYGLLLKRLIEIRLEAGITQKQVAERIGKSPSHVSMCENREREISIMDLFRWCEAIGISFSEFSHRFEEEVKQWRRLQNQK